MENILEKINTAGVKFLAPLTPEETFATIASETKKLVSAEYVSIFLEKNGELERVYASEEELKKIKIRKNGFTYQCFVTKKPYVISTDQVENIHPRTKKLKIESTIFIPLTYKEKAIGVLSVDSLEKEHFTAKELEILKLFGSMATMAIRKTELYAETQKALEMRDLFISLASHELRTPLTSINGYIQLLHSKFAGKDTSESKWVKELYSESIRLTNLVKELLEINRIKQGQLNYNFIECDLVKVINDAIERVQFIKEQRKINFISKVKEKNTIVIGDYDKLLQMVSAILSNAIKFSHNDTTILISLTQQKSTLILSIKDEGEGIKKEELTRIFEEFYKGSNSLRNQKEGLGVGLLLAKHIVASHKGEIIIHSSEGEGTGVVIKMPLARL
jgi:signal transduction histidine kinase